MKLPEVLYRGDGDRKRIRKLHDTLHFGLLQTNLTNGGNGKYAYVKPVIELASRHIRGWPKTHFISFTESRKTALRFGLNCAPNQVEEKMMEYIESTSKTWEFAVIQLYLEKINWKQVDSAVYRGQHGNIENIILIDVVTLLSKQKKTSSALGNAKRDKEWLLFPANEKQFHGGSEYSGIWHFENTCSIKKYDKLGSRESVEWYQ